jgi:glycerophosphoryl diester phosphodiesterase
MAYTVNDVARARTLKAWGIDAIFTDIPADMLKAFR